MLMPIMWQLSSRTRRWTSFRREIYERRQTSTLNNFSQWFSSNLCWNKRTQEHPRPRGAFWELRTLRIASFQAVHKFPSKLVSGSQLDNIDWFTEGWVGVSKKIEDRYGLINTFNHLIFSFYWFLNSKFWMWYLASKLVFDILRPLWRLYQYFYRVCTAELLLTRRPCFAWQWPFLANF